MTGAIHPPDADIPPDTIEQAIAWAVRLRCRDGEAEKEGLDAWRAAGPHNEAAWQRIEGLLQPGQNMPTGIARDRLWKALLPQPRSSRRGVLGSLILATVAPPAIWLVSDRADYGTHVGAQRTIHLADGRALLMNTDTRVDLPDGIGSSRVVLRRGEIFVPSPAPAQASSARALEISTPHGLVSTVTGQLSLRVHEQFSSLSVERGRVSTRALDGGAKRWIDPAQSALLRRDGLESTPFEGPASQRWTAGIFMARAMRLADLLDELGRYRRGWISCAQDIGSIAVTGIYQLRDIDATLEFLADSQALRLSQRSPLWSHMQRTEKK